MDKKVEKLKDLYPKVFTEDGSVRLCGREACTALIEVCEQISGEVCGDKTRGYIHTEKVKAIYKQYVS